MTAVNVDEMIKTHEKSNYIEKFNTKEKLHNAVAKKPKVVIKMGKPVNLRSKVSNYFDKEDKIDETQYKMPAGEVVDGSFEKYDDLKNGIMTIASMPMRDVSKRDVFKQRLANSTMINRYAKNNVYPRIMCSISDELKALACYTYHYIDVYNS